MLSSAIRISLSLSLSLPISLSLSLTLYLSICLFLSLLASLPLPISSPILWRHKLRFRKLVRSHMRNTEVSRLLEHYAYIRTYLNITCIPIHIDTYASWCSHSRYIMHVISLPRSVGRLIRHGNVYHPETRRKVYRRESQREIYKRSTCSIERLENNRFINFSFSFLLRKRDRHIERYWDGVTEPITPRNKKSTRWRKLI